MITRRPICSEDLFQIKAMSDPQISPDGLRVAYVVTMMNTNTNKYDSRIYVASSSGEDEPKLLTSGPGLDFAPRWSPDGKYLAFISTREGSRQLWIIPYNGGEAERLSEVHNVTGSPAWSPDSKAIACIIHMGPEGLEKEETKPRTPRQRFSKNVLVIDQLRYKLDSVGHLTNKRWHLFAIQAVGPERGRYQQLTEGDINFSAPSWSPDGQFIVVAGKRISERQELDVINDIYVVPSQGGKLYQLTRNTGPANHPVWSPDGLTIAYVGHNRRRGDYTNRGIWIVSLQGGTARELTSGFKYPVGDYSIKDFLGYAQPGVTPYWSPDGQSIYMNVSAHGAVHLWRFSISDGRAVQLTFGKMVIYNISFSHRSSRVAMAVTTPTLPNDIWVGEINGDTVRERRLTNINGEWLNQVNTIQPIRYSFRTSDGQDADGWILYPAPYLSAKKIPAILQIHGGPTVMYGYVFFFEFQLLAANGFAVIYTNPRGSMGYGEEFAATIRGNWGNRDYSDLMAGLDAALWQGPLDPERLGVAGGSYGGYMTNWIITQNNRFKAAVSMRSISNLYSFFGTSDGGFLQADEYGGPPWEFPERYLIRSPISYASRVQTPLLLIHSDLDFRVPIEQGEQFYTALKFLRRKVRMVRFLNETHELSREGKPWHRVIRLDHILQWFQEYL